MADRALGEHGRLGDDVGAGLEVAELFAVLAAAAVAGAHALDDPVLDQQLGRGGLGEDVDAGLFGFLGEEAAQFRDRDACSCRLCGSSAAAASAGTLSSRSGGRSRPWSPPGRRRPLGRVEVGEQPRPSPRGRCWRRRAGGRRRLCPSRSPRPGLRRASRSAPARPRAAASACWRRRGRRGRRRRSRRRPRSARPPGSVGGPITSARVERRRELAGRDGRHRLAQPPFFALIASVSLGTILCRSPTTPRSENSKIGAFWSLLIARMFSEFCIPTLCWIAPEMPAAR